MKRPNTNFNREEVFAAVDESSKRMENYSKEERKVLAAQTREKTLKGKLYTNKNLKDQPFHPYMGFPRYYMFKDNNGGVLGGWHYLWENGELQCIDWDCDILITEGHWVEVKQPLWGLEYLG